MAATLAKYKRAAVGFLHWAIVAVIAVATCAIAKDNPGPTKEQSDCGLQALQGYIAANVAMDQRQGATLPTIETYVSKRRLLEAYCVQYVQCLNIPSDFVGLTFGGCLNDEDAERLKEH